MPSSAAKVQRSASDYIRQMLPLHLQKRWGGRRGCSVNRELCYIIIRRIISRSTVGLGLSWRGGRSVLPCTSVICLRKVKNLLHVLHFPPVANFMAHCLQ